MSEKIRSIVFADYRIQNENVPQFRSGFFIVDTSVWSKGEKRHFGSKELSRADGLKGKNAIWVKRIVAGVWSEREKRYLGQKNCRGHMV